MASYWEEEWKASGVAFDGTAMQSGNSWTSWSSARSATIGNGQYMLMKVKATGYLHGYIDAFSFNLNITNTNHHDGTLTYYVLDVDPRGLSPSQIPSRALASVSNKYYGIVSKLNYASLYVQKGIASIESTFYVAIRNDGTSTDYQSDYGYALSISVEVDTSSFGRSYVEADFGITATPQRVLADTNVTLNFTDRFGSTIALTFKNGEKTLYTGNASQDSVKILCPRSWHRTVGAISENEIAIDVGGIAGRSTASTSFIVQYYSLTISSPENIMVGTPFIAKVNGKTKNDIMTATFKYGDTVIHQETLTSDTISVVCPAEWFIRANYPAKDPMPVTVYFVDQDGKTVVANFNLCAPALVITGDKNDITTGLQSESDIHFVIENRSVAERVNELLTLKIMYSETVLESKSFAADETSVSCVREWYEIAAVRTSKILGCRAVVSDAIGRVGVYDFILNAGTDMEPILSPPSAQIIQPPAAADFPDMYIATYSKSKISLTVTRQTSAVIVSSVILYNNIEASMAHNTSSDKYEFTTFNALEGDTHFEITVTDERGFVKKETIDINDVFNYIAPSFKVNTLYRCDAYGSESIAGKYFMLNTTASIDENLPGNRIMLFTAEAIGGTVHDIESNKDMLLDSGFETSKKMTVRISIKDRLSNTISATWTITGGINIIDAYNRLVDKYYPFNHNLQKISDRIIGFPALMRSYYNTIDMELFLKSGLMPTVSTSSTNAAMEAAKLTQAALSPIAVSNINSCSATTASSAVLAVAKCLVRSGYQVKVKNGTYDSLSRIWTGNFTITNFSDEEDTATSPYVNIAIDSDLSKYVRQKIAMSLQREENDVTNIESLFKLSSTAFSEEMGKYSKQRLATFREACSACLDIMLQSGASNVSKVQNLIKYNTGNGNWSSGNLLNIPYGTEAEPKYAGISETVNYVTYRIGLDGTITADNTEWYDRNESLSGVFLTLLSYNKIGAGRYNFKCSATGTGVTMVVTVGSETYTFDAIGSRGITVNVPDNDTQLSVALSASRATLINNVKLTPVLARVAGDTGSGIYGDASEIVAYRPNTSITIRGVTCSINNDGSITLNGTATAPFQFFFANQVSGYNLTRGYYMYSLNTTESGVGAVFGEQKRIENMDSNKEATYSYITQQCIYRVDDYTNGPFRVAVEGAGAKDIDGGEFTGDVVFGFSVDGGMEYHNFIIKPQLECGSVKHDWVSPTIGAAGDTNMSQNDRLYYNLYQPYIYYLGLIDDEIKVRDREIEIVVGAYDADGNLLTDGAQTILLREKEDIQNALNFEEYLGEELWEEFASYRREDNLSNDNYISDGLNNLELFKSAEEFIRAAKREIYKSAEAQHSITGDLYNLLSMDEFKGIKDKFCTGNWIRVGVDGTPYKLRLYSYEIDYDNMGFNVEFTNIQNGAGTSGDVSDLLNRVKSMAMSYGAVARQAANGKKSKDTLDSWRDDGMPLSTKIVSGRNNQEFTLDQNGLSGKEFSYEENMYSPTQVKFGSGGIYATSDAWQTGKTVVGKYSFINPITGQTVSGYGSIAELLIGYMLLNNASGIMSDDGEIIINKDGIKTKGMTVTGDLQVRGAKNRIAETHDFGDRLMYSYETASPMFGDVGEGEIGEDGSCRITLDEIFAQTISDTQYQVFLQCYGDGTCYVSERHGGFFIVCGTPGMRFGWELKGGQAGYDGVRLEVANEKEK